MAQQLFDPEEIVTELDISHLVIEDDTPVDNFQSEEQQRLLVEPIYSSKPLPSPFLVAANVGLFYKLKGDPIVPEVTRLWLRWCDRDGQVIPIGAERAEIESQEKEAERQRAEAEQLRADGAEDKSRRLAKRLREMGINPDEI